MPEDLALANFARFQSLIDNFNRKLKLNDIVKRIWDKDFTVWKTDPDEISNRLGWLYSPESMTKHIPEISRFVEGLESENISDVLLMGMGGSSLSPEFFGSVIVKEKPRFNFHVIDSTHPGVVKKYSEILNPSETLYITSTKSGGTVETISLLKYFYNFVRNSVGQKYVGNHFVAITDPGSGLEKIAGENNFRKIFLNDPEIGGRFSALSYFGLLPAGLCGWDISLLLERAGRMSEKCRRDEDNPGILLGSLIGCLALGGLNRLSILLPGQFGLFGAWIEQLIAESTGKEGKGVLPIICGPDWIEPEYTDNRYFVFLKMEGDDTHDEAIKTTIEAGIPSIQIDLGDVYDFGGQFFLWGFATAIAGYILKINPFDQPNVESAKVAAREIVDAFRAYGRPTEPESMKVERDINIYKPFSENSLESVFESFFEEPKKKKDSYISIQAYLDPVQPVRRLLDEFKMKMENKLLLPVTVGFGPRYLHSTGQLHKGDSGSGYFIQLMQNYMPELLIPNEIGQGDGSIAFGTLIKAQCIGDRNALLQAKRNVLSIVFDADKIEGLERLISAI